VQQNAAALIERSRAWFKDALARDDLARTAMRAVHDDLRQTLESFTQGRRAVSAYRGAPRNPACHSADPRAGRRAAARLLAARRGTAGHGSDRQRRAQENRDSTLSVQ
jgi:hypothetical protein